ncbi:TonB-dependent receptor [Burkholderia savannae]|uniref:TonB-dependent receptor n=1 Tax=Burkholderia savannae TaxID=1637837 RepID=UPI0007642053|nr:TonB-dependent receptor [Burkholderia savannae]KWZ45253.1 TonB-dependent receptor [Burkholderia savannae]
MSRIPHAPSRCRALRRTPAAAGARTAHAAHAVHCDQAACADPSRRSTTIERCVTALACAMTASGALAADADPAEPARESHRELPTVHVTSGAPHAPPALSTPLSAGSRLKLASLDTPASVEAITSEQIAARGDRTIVDAVTRAAGFSTAAAPGNGGTALSVRGFAGQESVTTLVDGVRLYPAAGTATFPFSTWSAERIEVLRGPASVLYGEGAIGGVVDVVTKRPSRERSTTLQAGIGTQGGKRVAFDTTGALGSHLAYRFHLSDERTRGFVDRGDAHTTAVGGALKLDVDPRLSIALDFDYGRQKPATYFGAPVTNGVLDRALRERNYNVGDATIAYHDTWTRLAATYRAGNGVTLDGQLYYLATRRHWRDAESYALDAASRTVARGDYLEIFHRERQFGERLTARIDSRVLGRANRLVIGVEFNQIAFDGANNSPYRGASTVDAYGFDPGAFASPDPTLPRFRTRTRQAAAFVENRLEVLPRLAWVSGLRYDHLSLRRDDLIAGGTFDKTFAHTGWRSGLVYEITPSLAAYAQYTTGAEGVGSLVTLSASQANYTLATGHQWEAGVKHEIAEGRAYWTLAVYDIVKRGLVSTDVLNPARAQQVGRQSSRGVELAGGVRLPGGVTIDANAAWLRARYDDFSQRTGDAAVQRAGNVPHDIPQQSANLWIGWAFAPGWQANAGVRYVGRRYGDDANLVPVPSYTVFDASLAWQATRDVDVALYARNLANRTYAASTSNGGAQWLLGPSRSAELVATLRF